MSLAKSLKPYRLQRYCFSFIYTIGIVYLLQFNLIITQKAATHRRIAAFSSYSTYGDYSAMSSSMMVQADLATGEPGPKIAATPAL